MGPEESSKTASEPKEIVRVGPCATAGPVPAAAEPKEQAMWLWIQRPLPPGKNPHGNGGGPAICNSMPQKIGRRVSEAPGSCMGSMGWGCPGPSPAKDLTLPSHHVISFCVTLQRTWPDWKRLAASCG